MEGFSYYESTHSWAKVQVLGRSLEGRLCPVAEYTLPLNFVQHQRGRVHTGGHCFEFKPTPSNP